MRAAGQHSIPAMVDLRRRAAVAVGTLGFGLFAQAVTLPDSAATSAAPSTPAAAPAVVTATPVVVVGDGIALPLLGAVGNAERGRAIVANRQLSMCLLCHQAPIDEVRFQGDVSTNLAGAGSRWNAAQLRLRMVDARVQNPATVMPSYYRVDRLTRVASSWRDKPLLDAQQIEDVIAWLQTQQTRP
jgi:sulfur-oxidizing protein SoxX